mgnify:CR=1 FL=1
MQTIMPCRDVACSKRYPDIFPDGGRINLTLRRVTKPDQATGLSSEPPLA